jgi:hypothetical protein
MLQGQGHNNDPWVLALYVEVDVTIQVSVTHLVQKGYASV